LSAQLSPRELEIVEKVGRDGLSWPEVDEDLNITKSTRQTHVQRIMAKFGSSRPPREALVQIYFQHVSTGHVGTEHVGTGTD